MHIYIYIQIDIYIYIYIYTRMQATVHGGTVTASVQSIVYARQHPLRQTLIQAYCVDVHTRINHRCTCEIP